jgi:Domain of unknown function (DUF4278)
MKLIYRGNTYDHDPAQSLNRPFQQIRGVGPAYTLTCRGVTHQIDPQRPVPSGAQTKPATYELIYRGDVYRIQRPVQVEATQADGLQPTGGHRQFATLNR